MSYDLTKFLLNRVSALELEIVKKDMIIENLENDISDRKQFTKALLITLNKNTDDK